MKKILLIIALSLCFGVAASAQSVRVEYPLLLNTGKTFTTTTDSSAINLSATYNNGATAYFGQVPDSIAVVWYGYGGTTGDSIGLLIQYRLQYGGAIQSTVTGNYAMTTLDSITTQTWGLHSLPLSSRYAKSLTLYFVPITTGHNDAASTSAFPSTLFARLVYWYRPVR